MRAQGPTAYTTTTTITTPHHHHHHSMQVPLSSSITDFLHSGFVEYAFFIGTSRYRDLFRTSSQWWAYNDCVQRCVWVPV